MRRRIDVLDILFGTIIGMTTILLAVMIIDAAYHHWEAKHSAPPPMCKTLGNQDIPCPDY